MFDDELDAQIHRWYADILADRSRKVWPPRDIPYFSPSSANTDPREIYEKLRGAKRDKRVLPPHQGRWTRIGTAIGDTIQRDVLFAEKHLPDARFRFERNEFGEPMFEDFAKTAKIVEHRGKTFALYGTCDGIMTYVTEDGEIIRVGLEIKSKQTTYSATGDYSLREPGRDHVMQTICYSIMYGVDYYVILYVNGARKAWEMSEEDIAKYPDIRAFGLRIDDDMRAGVLDRFVDVLDAVETGNPPTLDIDKWTFNNHKTACALSLTDEEMTQVERKVSRFIQSSLPDWKKRIYADALEQIRAIREDAAQGVTA